MVGSAKLSYSKRSVCIGKVFRFRSKFEEHHRRHTGDRPFACAHCPKRFTQHGALRTHTRLHTGERPFTCQWRGGSGSGGVGCGRTFVSASSLAMHQRTHTGERSFACRFCGQLFAKKYHCERHEKRHSHDASVVPHLKEQHPQRQWNNGLRTTTLETAADSNDAAIMVCVRRRRKEARNRASIPSGFRLELIFTSAFLLFRKS